MCLFMAILTSANETWISAISELDIKLMTNLVKFSCLYRTFQRIVEFITAKLK